jgi:queuosine precursor transporter
VLVSGNRTSRIWALSGALFIVLAYLATIPTANWLVANLSPIPLGFGQAAPAGVALVGLALALRDWAREVAGVWATVAAMAAGMVLSYWVADARLATASAVAFGVSEVLDFVAYEPLRKRGLVKAVAGSNAVGLVVDSVLFLALAFGSMQYLPGQLVGKAAMTLLALAAIVARRRYAMR